MRANNDGTQECGVAITLQPGRADQDVISKGQEKIGQMGLSPCQGEISRRQQGCNLRPIVWCCTAHDPGTHRCSSSPDGMPAVSAASAWRAWCNNASVCATCSRSAWALSVSLS